MSLGPQLLDYLSSPYVGAGIAGFVSWVYLNRRGARGDRAAVFFAAGLLTLYLYVRKVTPNNALALSSAISTVYFLSLITFTVTYRISPFHPLAAYPGPFLWRISSIALGLVSLGGHRHLVSDDLHRKYGKFVRIGPNALSVNSPTASSAIYGSGLHMEKSESYNTPGHSPHVSLFFKKDKEAHTKRKAIWFNAFTGDAIDNFFPPLETTAWQLTQCIDHRKNGAGVVDIAQCISFWSYDFMGEMVFGGSNNLQIMRQGDPHNFVSNGKTATVWLDSIGQTPWLMDILWHFPASGDFHRLQQDSTAMMRTRLRAQAVKLRDLCSYLIEGDSRTGEQISVPDLEADSLVAIQAGADTTANAIAFVIYFLLSSPQSVHYKTLQGLLDKAVEDPTNSLDKKVLASIPFLDAVINESMRLATHFFLPRIVPKGGALIDSQFVPAGTNVALSTYSQQVSEENCRPDPLAYRPERWLPGGLGPGSKLNRAAVISQAFSSGPYVCVAKVFAVHQMRIMVARLLLTYDMELAPGFDSKAFFEGFRNSRTTVFDKPLLVKAVRRAGKSPLGL